MKPFYTCRIKALSLCMVLCSTAASSLHARQGSCQVLTCMLMAFCVTGMQTITDHHNMDLEDVDHNQDWTAKIDIADLQTSSQYDASDTIKLTMHEVLQDPCPSQAPPLDCTLQKNKAWDERSEIKFSDDPLPRDALTTLTQRTPLTPHHANWGRRNLQARPQDYLEAQRKLDTQQQETLRWIGAIVGVFCGLLCISGFFTFLLVREDCNTYLKKYTWYQKSKHAQCLRACFMQDERCCCYSSPPLSQEQFIHQSNNNTYYAQKRGDTMMV